MKPIFRTLHAYHVERGIPKTFKTMVKERLFKPLTEKGMFAQGWLEMAEQPLIEADGRYLLCYYSQRKNLNKKQVKQLFDSRWNQILEKDESTDLPNPDDIYEQCHNELMKYAPVKITSVYLLVSPNEKKIFISGSNASECETALKMLRNTLGSLKVSPMAFEKDAAKWFTQHTQELHKRKDNSYPLPVELSVNPYGNYLADSEELQKLDFRQMNLEQTYVAPMIKDLETRSINIDLRGKDEGGAIHKLANFDLIIVRNGPVFIKNFDYVEEVDDTLSTDKANLEEGKSLAASHEYAIEMFVVSQYANRIFETLQTVLGGYIRAPITIDSDPEDEIELIANKLKEAVTKWTIQAPPAPPKEEEPKDKKTKKQVKPADNKKPKTEETPKKTVRINASDKASNTEGKNDNDSGANNESEESGHVAAGANV